MDKVSPLEAKVMLPIWASADAAQHKARTYNPRDRQRVNASRTSALVMGPPKANLFWANWSAFLRLRMRRAQQDPAVRLELRYDAVAPSGLAPEEINEEAISALRQHPAAHHGRGQSGHTAPKNVCHLSPYRSAGDEALPIHRLLQLPTHSGAGPA